MSELDDQRRRAEAAAEIPTPPPEPPQPPEPVDGTLLTGQPHDRQTDDDPEAEQPETPPTATGRPGDQDRSLGSAQGDDEPGTDNNPPNPSSDTPPDNPDAPGADDPSGTDENLESNAATPDGPPRFNSRDMQATSRTDPLYHEDLYRGPDGKDHFDGDPLDTSRNKQGRLIYPDGKYAPDPNPRPTENLQERAELDLPSRRHYEPEPGASAADDAVTTQKADRESIESARDESWNKIKDIAEKLTPHDVKVEKGNDRNENDGLLAAATDHLSAAERLRLGTELPKLAKLNQSLKDASERLGTAGGALAVQREFPNAQLVSGGDGQKGTPGNLDRVVMIDERKQAIIVIEEKGVSSGLGSRIVPDTANPDGKNVRAEQGSTSYLRKLLQTDNKLATALDRDPALRQKMQAIINGGGQIRYLVARTAREGKVSVTDFKLDFARLRRATIVLPTRRRGA